MPKGKPRPEVIARYQACTVDFARRLLNLWEGTPGGHLTKKDIEAKFFKDERSNGKRISKVWRDLLDVETEKVHPMMLRIVELEQRVNALELCLGQHTAPPAFRRSIGPV